MDGDAQRQRVAKNERRKNKRDEARNNVELTMAGIRNNSAVLKEIESKGAI
jgi:hypothetical protein